MHTFLFYFWKKHAFYLILNNISRGIQQKLGGCFFPCEASQSSSNRELLGKPGEHPRPVIKSGISIPVTDPQSLQANLRIPVHFPESRIYLTLETRDSFQADQNVGGGGENNAQELSCLGQSGLCTKLWHLPCAWGGQYSGPWIIVIPVLLLEGVPPASKEANCPWGFGLSNSISATRCTSVAWTYAAGLLKIPWEMGNVFLDTGVRQWKGGRLK